jgi:predicted aspartyl protease
LKSVPYNELFDPPAPVLPLKLRIPAPSGWVNLVALVDTGADLTVIPADVAERYLAVAGAIRIIGVTGAAEEATLYWSEVAIGNWHHRVLLAGFGAEAIVGRDVLNRLNLTLEGPSRTLSLAPITDIT